MAEVLTGRGGPVILYCYHKDNEATRNHYELLVRKNCHNEITGMTAPGCPRLSEDHWCHPSPDPKWCWHNWDWLVYDWYLSRGQWWSFDRLIVVQWDCLVFGDLEQLFGEMPDDQIYVCYPSRVEDREGRWVWVEGEHRATYEQFCIRTQREFGWSEAWSAFIPVICLSRRALDRLARLLRGPGYCEYRLPTLAKAVGLDFWKPDLFKRENVNFGNPGPTPEMVAQEMESGNDRVFHPYYEPWGKG